MFLFDSWWVSQWFKGAMSNICYNALDRIIAGGDGDKIALYWEGNEPGDEAKLTYSELLEKVCQVRNLPLSLCCLSILACLSLS